MSTTKWGLERLEFVYDVESVLKIVDGDTYDLTVVKHVDAGFWMHHDLRTTQRFRLLGIDTPEVYGKNADPVLGPAASEFARDWFEQYLPLGVVLSSHKSDDFGRWLAEIGCPETGANLGLDLTAAGLEKA